MLAYHGDEGGGRPYETRNVDAVVTSDSGPGIGSTDRFDNNRRLPIRPFRELREGFEVCYGPDSASYGAAMRVIEGIKESLAGAPGHLVFNVLMEVLFDSTVRFFVVGLEGSEVVAPLVPDLLRDRRLTAHGIHRDNTAFDG